MILLADSGSTKTDWSCVDGERIVRFHTIGLSPYFVTKEVVLSELTANMPTEIDPATIEAVYFYGTGCGRTESKGLIVDSLQTMFVNATVVVDSDLVGAAKACYGSQPGLVAILGTGMNIGYWNGTTVETPMASLGFILGDEGSGADLGKRLLSALFEKKLSQNVEKAFFEQYPITLGEVLDRVYKQPRPNAYLASFAPFLSRHIDDETIRSLVNSAFSDFCSTYFVPMMQRYNTKKVSFVGSLALAFKDLIVLNLQETGGEMGIVVVKPMEMLEKQVFDRF
ncbi:MAG: ATPase [Bacteroidales bacterium]|nr:ATPase [Bacteroidales bacterium]